MTQPAERWEPRRPVAPEPLSHGRRTARQRHILDELEKIVLAEGFMHLKLTAIASRLGVSPTTLYTLGVNKDELLLLVLDRWYQRTGRDGIQAFEASADGAARLRAWLTAAVEGARDISTAFLRDVERHPQARMLGERYQLHFLAMLESLLAEGAADGSLVPGDPRLTAEIIDAAMKRFADPAALARLGATEQEAVAALLDVVLDGLLPRKASKR